MPKGRARWQITLDCLTLLNMLGKASRMQLYDEVFGNEENLNRWLGRLVKKWRAVEELDENGRKYYTKTDVGHLLKSILKYHSDVCYPLKEILVGFEPSFSPPEKTDQSLTGVPERRGQPPCPR